MNASFLGLLAATRERNFTAEAPPELELLGTWPLSETAGNTFVDTVGGNDATLAVPSWTVATHEWNRRGIAVGTDHALEVSNGGPAIPMILDYKNAATTLAFYVCPLSELRGEQHWNTSAEGYRREFLAHCDDGSTPGSFAIERRRFSTTEWRVDGYVRNGSGTAVRFSGGLNGISGATLPVDVAKRIVLTQSTTGGAKLYLDGSLVGSLGSVTTGWGSLSTAITFGSSSNTGHANDRSPFWGRIDEIKVWQGNLDLTAVQALPAASSTLLWKYPADFNSGTDINIADYGPNDGGQPNRAVEAAITSGKFVYQAEGDTTWYICSQIGSTGAGVLFPHNCKGMINCQIRRPSSQNSSYKKMLQIADNDWGEMSGHGDKWLGSFGGWRWIGCKFDGNARGQNWHPHRGEPGYLFTGFGGSGATEGDYLAGLQHCPIMKFHHDNPSVKSTHIIDACEYMDNTGDGIECFGNVTLTIKSCRFWGCFRGPVVVTGIPCTINFIRSDSISRARSGFGTVANGCGLHDIESDGSFSGTQNLITFRDIWAEDDWDDQAEGQETDGSAHRYYNCHTTGASLILHQNDARIDTWAAYYSTFSYYKYNNAWWEGFWRGTGLLGSLFDHCFFVANGTPFNGHESWIITPTNADTFRIQYNVSAFTPDQVPGAKLWTMRQCEFRPKNLPGGIPTGATGNIRAILCQTMENASMYIRMEGVKIDTLFHNTPFDMGGLIIEHDGNCLHERTGNTTPWTNATSVLI